MHPILLRSSTNSLHQEVLSLTNAKRGEWGTARAGQVGCTCQPANQPREWAKLRYIENSGSETLLFTLQIQWNINQRIGPSLKQTLHHCQAGCLKDRNIVSVRKFMELSLICVFFGEIFFESPDSLLWGFFNPKSF